ncbi:MAG: hypothetical protein M5U14_21765 [Acidimicrobiia bacterium]|nr:hypothetical protein [Acidimicrobiia bacterium]
MAVFEGAVRPDDVAAVTGHPDPLEVLCRLAEGSLLVAHTSGSHGRFGMLRTIRDRAAHLLAERGRVGELTRRHARHVAGALAEADRDLRGPGESEARARIEELLDEARSAQAWAARHDLALALRLCGSLYLFGQSGLRDELLGWSAGLADRVDESGGRDGALVLTAAAQRAVNAGDLPAALDLARRAVALSDDGGTRALACELVSDVHLFSGRLDDARSSARAGLAAAEEAGDAHGVVASLVNLALVASYGGDHAGAQRVLAAAPADPALSPSDRAWLRYSEGEVVLDRDPDRALAALDDAATLAGAVGNRYLSGVARVSATSLRARVGDPEPALRSFVEVIEHWRGRGDQPHQLTTLRNLVVLLQRLDAAPEVAELLGAVEGGEVAPTFGEEAARLDSARTWVVERLGAGEADRRAGTGRARTVDEAAEAALGWIATLRG